MQKVTITLSRHIERAVIQAAKDRDMQIEDLCEELIEVALVSLGQFGPKTPIDDFASRQEGPFEG